MVLLKGFRMLLFILIASFDNFVKRLDGILTRDLRFIIPADDLY
jgi:hypothetical protein